MGTILAVYDCDLDLMPMVFIHTRTSNLPHSDLLLALGVANET